MKTADNGTTALEIIKNQVPDLIISDILMPKFNGFDLLKKTRQNQRWVKVPFIFLSAMNQEVGQDRARELGAEDYLAKPYSPQELLQSVQPCLKRAQDLEESYTLESYLNSLKIMSNAVESRDLYTAGHLYRVAFYAAGTARELGWMEDQINQVHLAAVLHDLGKVIVPDSVLNRQGPLTDQEWSLMRQHPEEGERILLPIKHLQMVVRGVRHHHERYDGGGHPDGLAGDQIPIVGRLLAVVDAFDAMTGDRSYRKGLSPETALQELHQKSETQFDPDIVSAFLRYWQKEGKEKYEQEKHSLNSDH